MRLSGRSIVRRRTSTVSAAVADDVVLFDETRGRYFGINGIGAEIWRHIESDISVSDLCRDLEATFDVDGATCQRDVLAFLSSFQDANLLIVSGVLGSIRSG